MRILVTGVPGLLSDDLIPILRTRHEVVPCSLPDLDITDREAVLRILPHHLPRAGHQLRRLYQRGWGGNPFGRGPAGQRPRG